VCVDGVQTVAARVGVHVRSVQDWEAGPRRACTHRSTIPGSLGCLMLIKRRASKRPRHRWSLAWMNQSWGHIGLRNTDSEENGSGG